MFNCVSPNYITIALDFKAADGGWHINETAQTPHAEPMLNDEMKQLKAQWAEKQKTEA